MPIWQQRWPSAEGAQTITQPVCAGPRKKRDSVGVRITRGSRLEVLSVNVVPPPPIHPLARPTQFHASLRPRETRLPSGPEDFFSAVPLRIFKCWRHFFYQPVKMLRAKLMLGFCAILFFAQGESFCTLVITILTHIPTGFIVFNKNMYFIFKLNHLKHLQYYFSK